MHAHMDEMERTEDAPPPPTVEDVQRAWAVALWDTLRDGAMREDPDALMEYWPPTR